MTEERDTMYDRLMEMNDVAFTAGSYEVAFHSLTAAFHRAKELGSISLLLAVEQCASTQLHLIDTLHSTHVLSSSSARSRGHTSVYMTLIKQTEIERQKVAWKSTYK